jgi:translation initiation factor 1 (eIF-1/SUI1)
MTETLNSIDWFANYKKFNFKEITIEDVYFNYIALTDELVESVKSCTFSAEMLEMAADYGISNERERMIDDDDDLNNLDAFWCSPKLSIELESSIRQQLGQKVCEISGLAETIEDMKALEDEVAKEEAEAALIKVGDVELAGSTLIDNLNQDSLEQDATAYANA